ncbi:MAG: DUF4838 domain-containing protein [Pirellulaceae bacterium]
MTMLPTLAFACFCLPIGAVELVDQGKATSAIVVPNEPLPVVSFAAEELQYHIERATGARLAIVKESQRPADSATVFVGACQATAEAGIRTEGLAPNGFILKVNGNRIFLVGDDTDGPPAWVLHNNRTRVGTLFAVYEFLEQELQVRWLWPGPLGEVIPPRSTMVVPSYGHVGKPALIHARWRDGGASVAGTAGWSSSASRSRFLSEQGKWLRRHRFALGVNMDMAHAFTDWWDRHKEDHPDYFNLLPDGTRRSDPNYHGGAASLISMCVSNPGFHRAIVERWRQSRSPQDPHVDVSENDTSGKCTCPKCLAWDVPDPQREVPWEQRLDHARKAFEANEGDWSTHLGSLSDRYARYYLEVQREAEKIDPRAVVMGYAYANYVDPPRQTQLNDRVVIGVVPPMVFPWTDEARLANRQRWDGWSETGAKLFLRPNWMLDGHNMPMIVARKLGEDFRYFAQHGMIGTDFDSLTGQYASQGLNLYTLARLHSHPEMTVDEVLEEYFSAFGQAADSVRAYCDHWQRICDAVTEAPDGLHWSFFYRQAHEIFTPAAMARGKKLLEAAMREAKGDDRSEQRVAFLRKGLRHAELTLAAQAASVRYREAGDIQGFRVAVEALDHFRRSVESELIGNMAFLAWAESRTWDRPLLQVPTDADPAKSPWDERPNLLSNGGLEDGESPWRRSVMCGDFNFAADETTAHSGQVAAKLQCIRPGPPGVAETMRTRIWGRWYRTGIAVDHESTYRLRVWVKTSHDFSGRISVWVTGDSKQGTVTKNMLNTEGQWRPITAGGISPQNDTLGIYLNLMDGTGTAWFDDIKLAAEDVD